MTLQEVPDATKTAVITVATKNRIAAVRVLMQSLKRHEPQWHRFCLQADQREGCFDPGAEDYTILEAEELVGKSLRQLAFRYDPFQLCCALKPWGMIHLLREQGFQRVIYLDSDIVAYRSFDAVSSALDTHDIVLTPHVTQPLPQDGKMPADENFLRHGLFNAGFLALKNTANALEMAHWWRRALEVNCLNSYQRGLFVDQKWLDLVPCLFPSTSILRNRGCNVAYWNLPHRPLSRNTNGHILAADDELTFFHFSCFRPSTPDRPVGGTRYNRQNLGSIMLELLDEYAKRLETSGWDECSSWPYTYCNFSDGTSIHECFLDFYRDVLYPPDCDTPKDPFDAEGGQVLDRLLARWGDSILIGAAAALFRYAAMNPHRYPRAPLHDQFEFARWFTNFTRRRKELDTCFACAQQELLDLCQGRRVAADNGVPPSLRAVLPADHVAHRLLVSANDRPPQRRNPKAA